MRNDKTTFKDLSVFPVEGNKGIISLIDYTTTNDGRDILYEYVSKPPETFEQLKEMQAAIRFWAEHDEMWPPIITNGTLVMLDKFFETTEGFSAPPSGMTLMFGDFWQRLFNKSHYFFTQFSITHIADFLKGCIYLVKISEQKKTPLVLQGKLDAMRELLEHHLTAEVLTITKDTSYKIQARLSYKVRRQMKTNILQLMQHYAQLDAWHSMGKATIENSWAFPDLQPALPVCFKATELVHPLLEQPKGYDVNFEEDRNFLLLTGANMSGKTTFMRSIGIAALLAHLGMGVPAKSLRISFFKGIITNMHVEDDILKGESYFYAEVKRIKLTAEKLQQQEPHLVLMDELFKGTNVHDAYECTRAVVEGLLHRPNHLMILSTHLYEVANSFREREDMFFAYFVTTMKDDESYHFEYELKEGVSNDRIGYRILQKEGVLKLLNSNDMA